jgi:hypothetical protein
MHCKLALLAADEQLQKIVRFLSSCLAVFTNAITGSSSANEADLDKRIMSVGCNLCLIALPPLHTVTSGHGRR